MRLDKWLWAARFFKNRPLATAAVSGGKAHVNGQRVKPGKSITVGDQLTISRDGFVYDVTVLGLNDKRRPASEAQLLYQESAASIAAREKLAEIQRIASSMQSSRSHRPDKHDRGRIIRFKRAPETDKP